MESYVRSSFNDTSQMTSEQLLKIYDDIDTSGDGEIEYSEFIAAAMNK